MYYMREAIKRSTLSALFIIAAVYARAVVGAALVIAGNALIYSKCLLSTGFDFTLASIRFDITTRDYKSLVDMAKMGALIPGLLLGVWGSWQALVKGVNPFSYMWKRGD